MATDALIVGAGFSKAALNTMPLVRGLGTMVLPKVEIPSRWKAEGKPPFDNFEVLLSYLASPQPFLDESENLSNQQFFLEVTLQLAEELWSVQHHAMGSSIPRWLKGLLKAWNDQQASVITLNYDTIVEAAIPEAIPGGSYRNTYPFHINFPSGTYGGNQYGPTPRTTFRLFKLHGSLNWFYGGLAAPSSMWPVDSGRIGRWVNREETSSFSEIRKGMTGLQPLIVPPTFGKSAYFENILIRETWREARQELLNSERVFLLGYSAPQADVQIRTLIAETMIGKRLVPVNTDSSCRCSLSWDHPVFTSMGPPLVPRGEAVTILEPEMTACISFMTNSPRKEPL